MKVLLAAAIIASGVTVPLRAAEWLHDWEGVRVCQDRGQVYDAGRCVGGDE